MNGVEVSSDPKSVEEIEKEEIERMQPTWEERSWLHLIALFFFLGAICVGLPLWWFTTSPEQRHLPTEKIEALSTQPITIGIDVMTINLDPHLSSQDMESLKQLLYLQATTAQGRLNVQRFSFMHDQSNEYSSIPVRVDYHFQVKIPSFDLPKHLKSGISLGLDESLRESGLLSDHGSDYKNSTANSYFFIILPFNFPGFKSPDTNELLGGVVRNIPTTNLVYIRSPCSSESSPKFCSSFAANKLSSTIFNLLRDHLVMPSRLQATYESVWWKGKDRISDSSYYGIYDDNYGSVRQHLAHSRTHQLPPAPGYEITITLISAFDSGKGLPVTDDWMWTASSQAHSLGDWLRLSVEPGLTELRQYLNLNLYSQYLYSVVLDGFIWSRISKNRDHRYYTNTQLSSVLNSLEAYLGQHSSQRSSSDGETDGGMTTGTTRGLHFVIVVDDPSPDFNRTARRPLQFHLTSDGTPSSVAIVPQWGAVISLDGADVDLTNLGTVLIRAIRSFIGLSIRRNNLVKLADVEETILLEPNSLNSKIAKWELDSWLRCRTIESLSTVALTLTSLVSMVQQVPNMVVNSHVANRVEHATAAWNDAVSNLAYPSSNNSSIRRSIAFISARTALENADAAFFDYSLLDLLYFPSDQVFGIYLPLFAPIGVPILNAGFAALRFFKKGRQVSEK